MYFLLRKQLSPNTAFSILWKLNFYTLLYCALRRFIIRDSPHRNHCIHTQSQSKVKVLLTYRMFTWSLNSRKKNIRWIPVEVSEVNAWIPFFTYVLIVVAKHTNKILVFISFAGGEKRVGLCNSITLRKLFFDIEYKSHFFWTQFPHSTIFCAQFV